MISSKWLTFEEQPTGGKTHRYIVRNKVTGDYLGVIKWQPGWRQHVFWPDTGTIYSGSCQQDIANFLNELKEQRKSEKK